MMLVYWLVLVCVCLLEWRVIGAESTSNAESCLQLGFNSLSLQCETCETLSRILNEEEEIYKDCLRCCSTSIEEMYEMAVLEVDKRFLSAFPNMPDIVKTIPSSSKSKKKSEKDASNSVVVEAAKKIHNRAISVRYRFGARPTLYLYTSKDDEEPNKVTFVGTWNMDDFIDFVLSHVKTVVK